VPIADYEKNLRQLVERLKQTDAHLIWRNTTPVPEGANGRKVEDAERYNAVAAKVMREHSIEIHDMYSFVKPKMQDLMLPNANVHFTAQGSDTLADEVVNVILAALKTK
jgi:lysophospholipase L1-like esterase